MCASIGTRGSSPSGRAAGFTPAVFCRLIMQRLIPRWRLSCPQPQRTRRRDEAAPPQARPRGPHRERLMGRIYAPARSVRRPAATPPHLRPGRTRNHGHEQRARRRVRVLGPDDRYSRRPLHTADAQRWLGDHAAKADAARFGTDKCFWLANAAKMAGVKRLDLKIHPPPDLAIEVDGVA